MKRVLILCTHNSARSQMAEALTREAARRTGLELDVHSAGTEATLVKEDAKTVMAELGLDLSGHTSRGDYTIRAKLYAKRNLPCWTINSWRGN